MNNVTGGLLPVDIWKSYMLKAHKGLKTIALDEFDESKLTEQQKTVRRFYDELGEAMIRERNLAAGLSPPPSQAASVTQN